MTGVKIGDLCASATSPTGAKNEVKEQSIHPGKSLFIIAYKKMWRFVMNNKDKTKIIKLECMHIVRHIHIT